LWGTKVLYNVGLPEIIMLLVILLGLYFLFRKTPGRRLDGEANRLKYILVWILAGFLSNLFTGIFTTIWAETFPNSIVNPPDQLGMFTAFYAITILGGYYIFIGTYSFFKNLDRRKVILFVWLASILGILTGVGQIRLQIGLLDLGSAYPNYAKYNITAIIFENIVFLGLTLRWIKLNPGFVGSPEVPSQTSSARKKPQIKEKIVSREQERSHPKPTPTITGKSFSSTNTKKSNPHTGASEDSNTQGQKLNTAKFPEKSDSHNAQNEKTVSDDIQNTDGKSEIKKKTFAVIDSSNDINKEEIYVDPLHLNDEIHAASKFGDKLELIKLLQAAGFTFQDTDDGLRVQSSTGETDLLKDDQSLFAYGKQYARN
jgi:hypothetical protein